MADTGRGRGTFRNGALGFRDGKEGKGRDGVLMC